MNAGKVLANQSPQNGFEAAVPNKRQPWKAVWPAPREPQSQANLFGFKKGEIMVFDGNAGNFFAREKWEVSGEVGDEPTFSNC